MKPIKIAFCYDFDSTLSPKNMQEYGLLQELGYDDSIEFWALCDKIKKDKIADSVNVYNYCMLQTAKQKFGNLSRDFLKKCGEKVELFNGVDTWFERINAFCQQNGLEAEHYIISSGNKEIIEATSIAKFFKKIYATSLIFDENDNAVWPAMTINYTNKTQFLYRINRGILDETDDSVNDKIERDLRPIPYENIVYIGDSLTDIPCMRLVMKSGGNAIGVYSSKDKNKIVRELLQDNRINFMALADYSEGAEIEKLVKDIVLKVKAINELNILNQIQKDSL